MSVVQSHYRKDPTMATREQVYAAGESVAAWLGLDSWVEVVTMQMPERVALLKKTILEKSA